MTNDEFAQVSSKIKDLTGIFFPESKKYLVESRIDRRIKEVNDPSKFTNPIEYMKYVSRNTDKNELECFYNMVTINETFFFRSPQQFDTIENYLLPEIIQKKPGYSKKLNIWSAASSSGEEIYTLAMILKEGLLKNDNTVNVSLRASDLDMNTIEKAKNGIYKKYSIRNMPPKFFSKYFKQKADEYILSEEIIKMVSFQQVNLSRNSHYQVYRGCDIIMLANVLIYFDQMTKEKVLANIFSCLTSGGYLLIGYSESLQGIKHNFETFHINKTIVYKKP
jgi:chemotaxis protein methyltransferase CheR